MVGRGCLFAPVDVALDRRDLRGSLLLVEERHLPIRVLVGWLARYATIAFGLLENRRQPIKEREGY